MARKIYIDNTGKRQTLGRDGDKGTEEEEEEAVKIAVILLYIFF